MMIGMSDNTDYIQNAPIMTVSKMRRKEKSDDYGDENNDNNNDNNRQHCQAPATYILPTYNIPVKKET